MPLAHPTHDMLAAYASGAASDGVALLVSAHATYCGRCRREIARLEAVSAAAMRSEPASPLSADALGSVMARLDVAPDVEVCATPPVRDAMLPAPVAAITGPYGSVRWRFVMPGVSRAEISLGGDEAVNLLRVRPGAGVPAHTHTRQEATLVLCGALRDRGRVYAKGDVALAGADDDHHPRAEPGADCVCLTVLSGSLRFTGTFGRALNIFAE